MEITEEIKFKVALQYYGCKFLVCYNIENNPVIETFEGKNAQLDIYEPDLKNKRELLILKPLSGISKSDAYEVARILFSKEYTGDDITYNKDSIYVKIKIPNTTINNNVKISFDGHLRNMSGYGLNNTLQAHQYLQSKGYDLPNYLLGGKTLYECGLCAYL